MSDSIDEGTSFTEQLLQAGKPIVTDILNHPLILSLADANPFISRFKPFSREKLIEARNNFYIQNYFYLVYGYRVAKAILLDTTDNEYLKARLGEGNNPILLEASNPLLADLVKDIRREIKQLGLSVEGRSPNPKTQEYILFKVFTAFTGDAEGAAVSLASLWVYYEISRVLKESQTKYLENDEKLEKWLKFLTADYEESFNEYLQILDYLITDYPQERIQQLEKSFVAACKFEYQLIDSLCPKYGD